MNRCHARPTSSACDSDDDNDGAGDFADNCPTTANASQADLDGDGGGGAVGVWEVATG